MAKPKPKTARREPKAATLSLARLVPVIIVLIFLPAIFLLPYSFPLHEASDSQSWEFGFNNTVAQGFIALLLVALFGWQWLRGSRPSDEDPVARAIFRDPEPFAIKPLLYTMGALQMVTCIVLLVWYSLLPVSHYGEITYFMQRIEAMILGQKPYIDFAYDYGPWLLAMPVDIYKLAHGALSVDNAYAISLLVQFVIGLALIAYVVGRINTRGRLVILFLIGGQWINFTMGLNYTPLRFTIAIASLFAIRDIYLATRDNPSRRLLLLGLGGFFFPLASFAISPEMGIALTIALLVYFSWFLLGPERRLSILVLAVAAGVAVTAFIFPSSYFASILSFGKGGANFPIFPTIHILLFLAAAIWIFPRLGIFAIRDRTGAGAFCGAFAFLAGMLILPATGRCDPGHIWINSVPLFAIALAAASWLRPRWWYLIWGGYIVIFPITIQFSNWSSYKGQMEGMLSLRSELSSMHYDADNYAHLAPGAPMPPIHYSKLLPSMGLDALPQVKIGLPLGDNEQMERFFKLTGRYVPEYHIPPYSDVFAASDLARKYQDFKAMDYVFIPTTYLYYLRPVDKEAEARQRADGDNKFLSGLLLFPVNLPMVHPLLTPDRDIMLHIAGDYRDVVKEYQSGVLLKRTAP
jgi:hypothetical protein